MGSWLWLAGVSTLTIPGIVLRLTGSHISPPVDALLFGLAVIGAAFLLSWAAEVAQKDISQGLALAALALIAVLPEYTVDLYFAWTAATKPEYVSFATANMTGANRLLIGFGWTFIVFLFWFRSRKQAVDLEPGHSTEVTYLGIATIYSFLIPIKGSISLLDTLVLVTLFGFYVYRVARQEVEEPELVGPAAMIGRLPNLPRRLVVLIFFVFAGAVILSAAEPFAESLIATGESFHIDQFFLVQWLAPLASEAPEIVVAALFTWRLHATAGLGALVSSKVNQWTLLIGTLPLVFSFARGGASALPLDARQTEELLLTAAQSAFAVAVLFNLRISLWEAAGMFILFIGQFFAPAFLPEDVAMRVHYIFSGLYIALAIYLTLRYRRFLPRFLKIGLLGREVPPGTPAGPDGLNGLNGHAVDGAGPKPTAEAKPTTKSGPTSQS